MSPWQQLYETLSGTLPGGFTLYFVVLLSVWAIWIFTYIFSGSITRPVFLRWFLLLTLIVAGFYFTQRMRHPAPLQPVRVWVQPFDAGLNLKSEAFQAKYNLEKYLEAANERLVGFQNRNMPLDLLTPVATGNSQAAPEGAVRIGARYALTGILDATNDGKRELTLSCFTLSWKGEVEETKEFIIKSDDVYTLGLEATSELLSYWKLSTAKKNRIPELTPKVLKTLATADTLKKRKEIEAVLLDGFTNTDSSAAIIWEELADLYVNWSYPKHKVDAEEAASRALQLGSRSSKAAYVLGLIDWKLGGKESRKKAVASWKLAHLYDRRNPDPLVALTWLKPKEIADLRMGEKEKILLYALRTRPSNHQVRSVLARYYRDERLQKSRALKLLDDGLIIHPENKSLLIRRAALYIKMQDWKRAETDLRTMLAGDSTLASAWYNMGIVARGKEDKELALTSFENAVKYHGPRDSHYYLGLEYEDLGEKEKALEQYRLRWHKRDNTYEDIFAFAAKDRIRILQSGVSLSRFSIQDKKNKAPAEKVDSGAVKMDSSAVNP